MFRGGRVDSRGTGIASGLGYEKGGRVGFSNGGSGNAYEKMIAQTNAGWRNPDITATDTGAYKDKAKWKDFKIKYPAGAAGEQILHDDYLQAILDEQALADSLMIEDINPSPGIWSAYENLLTPGGEKWWKDKALAEEAALIKEAEATGWKSENEPLSGEAKSTGETLSEQRTRLDQEYADKWEAFLKDQMKKGTPEEEIEKNRKIFQKAYGSGVADDASAMLLNFAGKALKPEATVKGAFGEFFEEEGKRPSERKKYKDAATTAAINAYLTGEKTLAEIEGFKAKTGYQIGAKSAAEKNKLLNASFEELKGLTQPANLKEKERVKGTAKLYTQYQNELLNENGTFNVIESKDNTPEQLFIEKYVGDYFMDSGTKEIFKIVILEDGTIGKKTISQG